MTATTTDNLFINEIHHHNRSMLGKEQCINLYHLLCRVIALRVTGEVVELGCYKGWTAALIKKTLDQLNTDKQLHLYDSFQGLPEGVDEDKCDDDAILEEHQRKDNKRVGQGWFAATVEDVSKTFQMMKLEVPHIHTGWFEDTLSDSLPEKIAFAHLDGDFFESTSSALESVYPRLTSGAICLVDDYCDVTVHGRDNTYPGVKRACDKFLADKPESISVLEAGRDCHGYFTKI